MTIVHNKESIYFSNMLNDLLKNNIENINYEDESILKITIENFFEAAAENKEFKFMFDKNEVELLLPHLKPLTIGTIIHSIGYVPDNVILHYTYNNVIKMLENKE